MKLTSLLTLFYPTHRLHKLESNDRYNKNIFGPYGFVYVFVVVYRDLQNKTKNNSYSNNNIYVRPTEARIQKDVTLYYTLYIINFILSIIYNILYIFIIIIIYYTQPNGQFSV